MFHMKFCSDVLRQISVKTTLILVTLCTSACSLNPVLDPVDVERFEAPTKLAVMRPGLYNRYISERYFNGRTTTRAYLKAKTQLKVQRRYEDDYRQEMYGRLLSRVKTERILSDELSAVGVKIVEPSEADLILVWGDFQFTGSMPGYVIAQLFLPLPGLLPMASLGMSPYGCFDYRYQANFAVYKQQPGTLVDNNISVAKFKQCTSLFWGYDPLSERNTDQHAALFAHIVRMEIRHLKENYVIE